jgi:uncharacterized protein
MPVERRDGPRSSAARRPTSASVFRFRGVLNDLLPATRRDAEFVHRFDGRPSVKDVIESLGVPHPEIGRIVVNEEAVGFDRRLDDGDRVEVEPRTAWGEPRFVLDGHLGKLAGHLRMLGFDLEYRAGADDDELARISADEDRILLTRDLGLLKRGIVSRGAFVRSDIPRTQLTEIVRRLGLARAARPFTRCMACNSPLLDTSIAEVRDRLYPRTIAEQTAFRRCPGCGRVYWRGSHHRRMERIVEEVLGMVEGSSTENASPRG